MAIRPLMTPEQQTMFKQAVAQGALQPYPYKEYCAITQEKAKKILKTLEGKVDFSQSPPEKGGRTPARETPSQEQIPRKERTMTILLRVKRSGMRFPKPLLPETGTHLMRKAGKS